MSEFENNDDVELIQHYKTFPQKGGYVSFVGSESSYDKNIYTIGGVGVGASPELSLVAATKSCADWLEFVTPEQIRLLPAPENVTWQPFQKNETTNTK